MNKKIKLVFIICLALGIALGALNLFAMSQKHHLAEIEEQQAATAAETKENEPWKNDLPAQPSSKQSHDYRA